MVSEMLTGKRKGNGEGTMGTFAGVFTPSVLTILGIILFLRLGFVVGSAGLGRGLLIIGLANCISILTTISLSAIATNLKVKRGGDYYLISRTLGVEFGGAIGIVLFLAQSVSIAFYCIGFGEAVCHLLPQETLFSAPIMAAGAVALLFVFAWLGADWATKFQYVVMGILIGALLSFFSGGIVHWDGALLSRNWSHPASGGDFWMLFAIFFPAVTGFTQGVSMSGDLKDPGKSLPFGTFAAVGISMAIYFGSAIVFAATLPSEILIADFGAMKQVASFDLFIVAGVIAATLSSGMASFLGAPRILQSMAQDRIFPVLLPFAQGSGATANPRRGVLLSAGIAYATICLGELNIIAPIVSMFFLVSYGLLNYATYYEARASSPSFRPRFRWFDKRLSLSGCVVCLGAMLAIDIFAGLIAVSILFSVFQYLKRTAGPSRWSDSSRSFHLQQVREHLLAAAAEPEHARDWRPQLLAFSDHARRRGWLLKFCEWIEGGSGLTSVARILAGEGIKMLKLRDDAEAELRADIAKHNSKAFPLALVSPNIPEGIHTLVQAFGVGPLRVNTAVFNWVEHLPGRFFGLGEERYGNFLRSAFRFGCNIIVLDVKEEEWATLDTLPPKDRRIDVWWWGDATSQLVLLLAYLMKRSEDWDGAKIRVLAADYERKTKKAKEELKTRMEEVRIEAEPKVIVNARAETIKKESGDATIVLLPFRLRGNQVLGPFGDKIEDLLPALPMTALVLAAEDIDLEAEPEDGKAGETARLLDELSDSERKLREAEKEASKALETAEEQIAERKIAVVSGDEKEAQDTDKAKGEAERAARKAAKAKAKFGEAVRKAKAAGVDLARDKEASHDSGYRKE
ncbi:MAG: amino acid permease [Deltaproteobacteria bacterium]|nr:amino acid permease [Deltaproteobacteria bacterium]